MSFIEVARNDYQRTPEFINTDHIASVEPVYSHGYTAIRMKDGRTIESVTCYETIVAQISEAAK